MMHMDDPDLNDPVDDGGSQKSGSANDPPAQVSSRSEFVFFVLFLFC